MSRRMLPLALALILPVPVAGPASVDAQVLTKFKDAASNAVQNETASQIERVLANAVRCAFDDPACIEKAKSEGKEVVLIDDRGEVLMDEDGKPITDPAAVEQQPEKPGTGAWANYDFVPGERILFYDDFSNDRLGDFPRRLTFVRGNWDVVEWQRRPLLRNTGPRHSAVVIPLPEELPERFTIEIETFLPDETYMAILATTSPAGDNWVSLPANYFQIGAGPGTGVSAYSSSAVKSMNETKELSERLMPVRIMVDGRFAKVYVGERRVANVPNAEFVRSDGLYLENNYLASEETPLYFGSIRVAAGGADLYDVLERDGRVATQGILFATGSDRIRPESTPTLPTARPLPGTGSRPERLLVSCEPSSTIPALHTASFSTRHPIRSRASTRRWSTPIARAGARAAAIHRALSSAASRPRTTCDKIPDFLSQTRALPPDFPLSAVSAGLYLFGTGPHS